MPLATLVSVILIVPFWIGSVSAATIETATVKTARGTTLEVVVHLPKAAHPRPAPHPRPTLVIGPGQGYHKELPIVKGLAERAAAAGWVVFRFDWGFFTEKGRPSKEFENEVDDFRSVIAFAKQHARVDGKRLWLAGKSLGTLAGYTVFHTDASLAGCLLLTPIFREPKEATGFYPGLDGEPRPVVFIHGQSDSLAKAAVVHKHLANAAPSVVNVTVPGDHSFNLGPYQDEAWKPKNTANIEAALAITLHWLTVWDAAMQKSASATTGG